jgi:hypothetical protein
MLGPSILFFSPTFSAGYAFRACRHAHSKFAARAGLALAVVEVLALVSLIAYGALMS